MEYLRRREEGRPRPGDDLGRLSGFASTLRARNEEFSYAAAHVDFYLSPFAYGHSNFCFVLEWNPRLTERPLHLYTNDASASEVETEANTKTPPHLTGRIVRTTRLRLFSFSFSSPWRLQSSTSVSRFVFGDCIFAVCDDTHALPSRRWERGGCTFFFSFPSVLAFYGSLFLSGVWWYSWRKETRQA